MPGRAGVSEELYSGNLFRLAAYIRIVNNPSFFPEHTYLPVHFTMNRICKAMKIIPFGPASRDFWNLSTRHDTNIRHLFFLEGDFGRPIPG